MHVWAVSLVVVTGLTLGAPAVSAAAEGAGAGAIDARALADCVAQRGPSVVILDVRARVQYMQGTVPGALHVGPLPARIPATPATDEVVIVASQPPNSAVVDAWKAHLAAAGIATRVLSGGLPAWRAAGLPMEIPPPRYADPAQTPFLIPRGSCEPRDPVQRFSAPGGPRPNSESPTGEVPP